MDFMTSLPKKTKVCDSIWVIMDRLTKLVHFIPIRVNFPLWKLAGLYIERIVSLHGIPSSIVLDRDLRFTSRFWESLQKALSTRLWLSSAYHLQMDGQSQMQTLKQS